MVAQKGNSLSLSLDSTSSCHKSEGGRNRLSELNNLYASFDFFVTVPAIVGNQTLGAKKSERLAADVFGTVFVQFPK